MATTAFAGMLRRVRLAALVFLLVQASPLLSRPSAAAYKGAWTPTHTMPGVAIHLALLPGDGDPYHSRILWWQVGGAGLVGGQWGWKIGNDGCASWPGASFDTLGFGAVPDELFCSGNTVIDGRLITPGGWESEANATNGIRRVRIFTPGGGSTPGSWAEVDSMASWRWYPSTAVLRDGRVVTVSGSAAPRIRHYGGRGSGTPEWSDSLYMFMGTDRGYWVPSVQPTYQGAGSPPVVREGHSAVETPSFQIYFGGRDSTGTLRNDTYRLVRFTNQLQPEFEYRWQDMPGLSNDPTIPAERREHAAMVKDGARMVVYGGLGRNVEDTADSLFSDVWKLNDDDGWEWTPVTVLSSSEQPTARHGHAVVYDSTFNRMLMFGGMDVLSGDPSETDVWAFEFTSAALDSGTWSKATLDCPDCHPAARFDHTLALDAAKRSGPGGSGQSLLMFGGRLTSSACSDSLWRLWLYGDGSVEWQHVAVGGTNPPSARAGHSATFEPETQRLYVFGGETGAGAATDDYVYVTDLRQASPVWDRWAQRGYSLTGHTAMPDPTPVARLPEIFTPSGAGGSWEVQAAAPLFRVLYPPTFTVNGGIGAGGRVVTLDKSSYFLDLKAAGAGSSAGPWRQFAGDAGFSPLTGVMYQPGRIMIAGGKDASQGVTGETKRLNAADSTSIWQDSSNDMQPRFFHNLVLLPTGEVLAVGGTEGGTTSSTNGVWRPEIWDPVAGSGAGSWRGWSGTDSLAANGVLRNYHSTAILLPDARVLVAGGNTDPDFKEANLFCPPYLFDDAGDLLTRPVIDSTAPSITWGDEFTICADTEGIERVALIRAPATTHSFDQSQRYVPLGFIKKSNPERLIVHTPASPDSAPPGPYMLFITGSSASPDVPSVAEWVHVRDAAGRDTCDTVAPITRKVSVDLIGPTSVGIVWDAPADDDSIAFSGRATAYEVRRKSGPIQSESDWSGATRVFDEPALPKAPGEEELMQVDTLSACTVYYLALRSTDDNLHPSAIPETLSFRTLCSGGGGLAARRAPAGDAAAGRVAGEATFGRDATSASLRPAGGTIVAERRQVAADRWEVYLSRVSQVAGLEGEDPGIVLQNADGSGGWRTTGRFDPGLDGPIAIAALRSGSRVVFLGNWLLGDVAGSGMGVAGPVALTQALHSREGDVTSTVAEGGVDLLANDALTLTYESAQASSAEQGWFVTIQRGGTGSASRRGPGAETPPVAFALHQNEPNPFGAVTTIRFDLPRAAHVKLEVFDLLGRRVATLADAAYSAGFHAVPWNHRSTDRRVSPGMYVYRVVAGEQRAERKMMLVP